MNAIVHRKSLRSELLINGASDGQLNLAYKGCDNCVRLGPQKETSVKNANMSSDSKGYRAESYLSNYGSLRTKFVFVFFIRYY